MGGLDPTLKAARLANYLLALRKELLRSGTPAARCTRRWCPSTNFQVARIILSPRLRIEPQLLRVRASQRTSVGLAIHANTITITPGTISLDVRDGTILVHALTEAGASQDGSGDIDRKISWVEGRA
jgi:hypothetical protein